MDYETISFSISNAVARLVLNRPDRLNAITIGMHQELADVLGQIESNKNLRCLYITGAGRGFCTGQDLEERRVSEGQAMPDLGESLMKRYNPIILRLQRLEIPVVCGVNGLAVGAGAGLALACDIVIASEKASFILPFNRLGLIPDSGTTWTLPRAIGHPRALASVLLSEKITAQQAEEWGMIWKTVADDVFQASVDDILEKLCKQPNLGMALSKKAFQQSLVNTLAEQLELESNLQRRAGSTLEYRENVLAFLNKK